MIRAICGSFTRIGYGVERTNKDEENEVQRYRRHDNVGKGNSEEETNVVAYRNYQTRRTESKKGEELGDGKPAVSDK